MRIQNYYDIAREKYAEIGIDTDEVLKILKNTPVSVHCWELDDLTGFEKLGQNVTLNSGGLATFGNAPGKPKTQEEYFEHLHKALSLIPGTNRVAIHAIYLEADGTFPDRDKIEPENYACWIDFAKSHSIALDMNPTYFSHPLADNGFTLSSADDHIRNFWIEHGIRCRKIGECFGKELGSPCITNHWIPDGYKDFTIDKSAPRLRLIDSLDRILAAPISSEYNKDSLESKLFGLGSESYVTGSHEFYTNYVMSHDNCIICLDLGHYHPTESVAAKLSSYLAFDKEIMLHISRPVRWDSDHVPVVDDETQAVLQEIVRSGKMDKVHIGLDFFDASINRIAATVLGARSAKIALLKALLEPTDTLRALENDGDFTSRLCLLEDLKNYPWPAVWDMFCEIEGTPSTSWWKEVI